MAQVSFGKILCDAREHKGYDLATVARRLRIRPDILQAIEASDFSRMPPRGYARNMVNAYARFLGLNPTETTRRYMDEHYAYQVGRAREESCARQSGLGTPPAAPGRPDGWGKGPAQGRGAGSSRAMYANEGHRGHRGDAGVGRTYAEGRTHRTTREALPHTQYTNFYSGPKAPAASSSRLVLVVGGIAALVVLIVVAVLVFVPKEGTVGGDVPKVPVSGLDNPTDSGTGGTGTATGNGGQPAPAAKLAPTKTTVTFTVAEGKSGYLDVFLDGAAQVGEDVGGPYEKSFEVTDATGVLTANIVGDVTVTQDGTEVPLEFASSGVASVSIDFAEVLAAWQAENAAPPAGDTAPEAPPGEGA